jgi:hypothetical protein
MFSFRGHFSLTISIWFKRKLNYKTLRTLFVIDKVSKNETFCSISRSREYVQNKKLNVSKITKHNVSKSMNQNVLNQGIICFNYNAKKIPKFISSIKLSSNPF